MNKKQSEINQAIRERLESVLERIQNSAIRSGRSADAVRLITVSKYAALDDGLMNGFWINGCRELGESRPQRLYEKAEFFARRGFFPEIAPSQPSSEQIISDSTSNSISDSTSNSISDLTSKSVFDSTSSSISDSTSKSVFDSTSNFISDSTSKSVSNSNLNAKLTKSFEQKISWHMIGTLQRNKIRKILPYVSLIHSVDNLELLLAIERILEEERENPLFPQRINVLLEVHINDDENKHGFLPLEILPLLDVLDGLKHICVQGLMGMGGLDIAPSETRRQFTSLRNLAESLKNKCPKNVSFQELSMGMSHDFEIAVEEGATFVRIGSILYP